MIFSSVYSILQILATFSLLIWTNWHGTAFAVENSFENSVNCKLDFYHFMLRDSMLDGVTNFVRIDHGLVLKY